MTYDSYRFMTLLANAGPYIVLGGIAASLFTAKIKYAAQLNSLYSHHA